MEWEDGTTYSQNDEEHEQRIWKLRGKHLSLYVIKAHMLDPENWVMQCYEVNIRNRSILPISKPLKEAKVKALKILEDTLNGFVETYDEMEEFIKGE